MKQKHANRPNWERIIEKRYFQEYICEDNYEGYISYLFLDSVKEPLIAEYGTKKICILDNGFTWMMLFPSNQLYSVTVMINEQDKVVQWYFDIIHSLEITPAGVPYINDLYLDLIVLPNGEMIVKDEDELNLAFKEGLISDGRNTAKGELCRVNSDKQGERCGEKLWLER
jgi:uncharacterized protein